MKNSSARQGTIALTHENLQKIACLKEIARNEPQVEETDPPPSHHITLSGIEISFVLYLNQEEGYGQYQLCLSRTGNQVELDEAQAVAVLFFDNREYQIMPHERNAAKVKVLGLFIPL